MTGKRVCEIMAEKGLLKKEDGAEKGPRSLTLEGYRDLQKN